MKASTLLGIVFIIELVIFAGVILAFGFWQTTNAGVLDKFLPIMERAIYIIGSAFVGAYAAEPKVKEHE